MKKLLAYFFGGIACMGVGAGVYIAAGVFYRPPAPVMPFAHKTTTTDAVNELLPLISGKISTSIIGAAGSLGSDESTASPRDDGKKMTIFFGGDIMLGRDVAGMIAKNGNDYPFAKIKDVVSSADYAIANLEGPLTKTNNAPGNDMRFHFDPAMTPALSATGFDALSLANNHGLDQGAQGFADTKNNLTAAGLGYFGNATGVDGQTLHFTVGGQNFAAIGAQDVYRQIDPDAIAKEIAAEKAAGNFVIIYPHWGVEYSHAATKRQTTLAYAFIDAGADLVVGMHPHVVEGIEMHKGKLIFYSLGNLVFDQYFSAATQEGLGLRLNIDGNGSASVDLLPYVIPKSQPAFADGDKKAKMLSDLASWSSPALKEQIFGGNIKF
jgi:poly-gamma-glutamate synthesis protein (capsule biosynthesis protein)